VKRIAEMLGVTRSNLVERAAGKRPKRGPQTRAGDPELTIGAWMAARAMDAGGPPRSSSASGDPPATILSTPSGSTG